MQEYKWNTITQNLGSNFKAASCTFLHFKICQKSVKLILVYQEQTTPADAMLKSHWNYQQAVLYHFVTLKDINFIVVFILSGLFSS